MSLRELWWHWNPRRLQRRLKQATEAIEAIGAYSNLCSFYFDQMRAAQKRADLADKLANVYAQQIEGYEMELQARNGELEALRRETQ